MITSLLLSVSGEGEGEGPDEKVGWEGRMDGRIQSEALAQFMRPLPLGWYGGADVESKPAGPGGFALGSRAGGGSIEEFSSR